MASSTSFLLRLSIVALGLQVGAACGPDGRAYQAHAAENWEYERPFAEVWPELQQLLKEQSYEFADTALPVNRTVETKPLRRQNDPSCAESFVVRHIPIDAKKYALHTFLKVTCIDNGAPTARPNIRAWDTEWELIERVEPVRASAIRQKSAKAQQLHDKQSESCSRGCAAGCAACEACASATQRAQ